MCPSLTDHYTHIAKDKAMGFIINQKIPTPQAIGTWLRRLSMVIFRF